MDEDILLTEEPGLGLGFVVSLVWRKCERFLRRCRSVGNGTVDILEFCTSSSRPLGSINGSMQIPRNKVEMTRKIKAAASDDDNGNLIARPLWKWRLVRPIAGNQRVRHTERHEVLRGRGQTLIRHSTRGLRHHRQSSSCRPDPPEHLQANAGFQEQKTRTWGCQYSRPSSSIEGTKKGM